MSTVGPPPQRLPWASDSPAPVAGPPSGGEASRERTGPSPRSALLFWLGLAAVAAAAIVVASAALGGGGGALSPIAQAAERTAHYPGSRMSFTASISAPGIPTISMQGGGVYNGSTQRSQIAMSAQGPPPLGLMRVDEVGDAGTIYMSSPLFNRALPEGKSWMELRPFSGNSAQTAILGQADPRQQLDMLRAVSDDATVVGYERIRGVRTTHYSATLDQGKVADLLRSKGDGQAAAALGKISHITGSALPIEAWIDQSGLLRRVSMTMSLPLGTTGAVGTMRMTMDLYDFGVKPQVNLPPSSQVYDATSLAQNYLSQAGR